MSFNETAQALTPDLYQRFKRAVELGKWADGRPLSPEQRTICMQAVIAYEQKHFPPEQRTGYIPPKSVVAEPETDNDQTIPLKWQ